VAGVAVDADDNVCLFNRSEHQLMVFDRGGSFIKSWDRRFSNPHGIHIGPDGNIYLADRGAHVVLKYSPDEKLLLTLGPSDTGYDSDSSGGCCCPGACRARALQATSTCPTA
jgi:DNA-binding beta-propeller fold protein YncE